MTAKVWPFRFGSELIEAMSWQTDVIRTRNMEQRIPTRVDPRTDWHVKHTLTHRQYHAARALARDSVYFRVPDWTTRVILGPVSSGSGVVIGVDVSDTGLQAGDDAMLWDSEEQFQVVSISAAGGGSVTLASVASNFSNARLLALRDGFTAEGLQAQRPAGPIVAADITFSLTDTVDDPASAYATYRSYDLMSDAPRVADGAFDEAVAWPLDVVDNSLSVPVPLSTRAGPDEGTMMRWHVFTRAETKALRRWLMSRSGSTVPFWYSSHGRDLDMAATLTAASVSLRVYALPGLSDLVLTTLDIELRTLAGASYYRQVTAVTPAAPIGGRDTLILTLDSATGADIAPEDVKRISRLRLVRFAADRVELLHRAGAGCAARVPCIEVAA